MEVANFRSAGEHALLNHAEHFVLHEMPAVTVFSPSVDLGGRRIIKKKSAIVQISQKPSIPVPSSPSANLSMPPLSGAGHAIETQGGK